MADMKKEEERYYERFGYKPTRYNNADDLKEFNDLQDRYDEMFNQSLQGKCFSHEEWMKECTYISMEMRTEKTGKPLMVNVFHHKGIDWDGVRPSVLCQAYNMKDFYDQICVLKVLIERIMKEEE